MNIFRDKKKTLMKVTALSWKGFSCIAKNRN
jgi:hypothetical protein